MGISAPAPESTSPVEVALRRDEAGDRTREQNRSGVLDALRAVAALMVLGFHSYWLALGSGGGTLAVVVAKTLEGGVYLFFAVSGYLIAGPFLRALVSGDPLPRAAPYFVRRVARIYPAYWAALTAAVLLFAVHQIRPYQVPVHLLLLQGIWPRSGEAQALFVVAWTLGVEAAFYVLVPLIARALRAIHPDPWRPGRLAALVLAAGCATVLWTCLAALHFGTSTSTGAAIARNVVVSSLAAFCPGMIVALAALGGQESRGWRWFRGLASRPWLCFSLAGLLWLAAYAVWHQGSAVLVSASPALYFAACGLILACCVAAGEWITWPVRILAPIGLVSYGIYLWHAIVVKFIEHHPSLAVHGSGLAWLLDAALVLAVTLPIAAASWFGLERPLMHRAARWAKRRTTVARQGSLAPVRNGSATGDLAADAAQFAVLDVAD